MRDEEEIDLNMVVELYDPHSGQAFHGAAARPPRQIMKVVEELEGAVMPLYRAVEKLKEVGIGHITIYKDCIMLNSHSPDEVADRNRKVMVHGWRLLRFR